MTGSLSSDSVFQLMYRSRCLHAGCFVLLQNYVFKTDMETKAYCISLSFESWIMKDNVNAYRCWKVFYKLRGNGIVITEVNIVSPVPIFCGFVHLVLAL